MSVYERMRVRGGGISSGRGAASVGARARSVGGVMSEARVRAKHAVMERVGYVEVARIVRAGSAAQARMELRPALEAALNADVSLGLGFDERNALIADVLDDMTGLGPLQALLEDDSVTEIMVNGLDRTYIERGGVLCRWAGYSNLRSRSGSPSTASSLRWDVESMSGARWSTPVCPTGFA